MYIFILSHFVTSVGNFRILWGHENWWHSSISTSDQDNATKICRHLTGTISNVTKPYILVSMHFYELYNQFSAVTLSLHCIFKEIENVPNCRKNLSFGLKTCLYDLLTFYNPFLIDFKHFWASKKISVIMCHHVSPRVIMSSWASELPITTLSNLKLS